MIGLSIFDLLPAVNSKTKGKVLRLFLHCTNFVIDSETGKFYITPQINGSCNFQSGALDFIEGGTLTCGIGEKNW